MAKPMNKPEVEATLFVLRKVAPERYDVVRQVVRGQPEEKRLEHGVSLVVAREAAKTAIKNQAQLQLAPYGGVVDA